MVNINSALLHNLLKIMISKRVSQIEKHCKQDHRSVIMRALDANHRHQPIISAKSPPTALHLTGLSERPKILAEPKLIVAPVPQMRRLYPFTNAELCH
jgi:hypothetical protein